MSRNSFPDVPIEFGMFDWVEHSWGTPGESLEHRLQMADIADRRGFFGWHIAEHHGSPLCLNISPSLLLASAAQRTSRVRLGALTYCLPWYNPYRLYNELCVIDQLSHGRLDLGVGRGVNLNEAIEIWSIKTLDEARERYRETLDILFYAFTHKTLDYQGKYFSYSDTELNNVPYQRPYPPLWFPSSNQESVEFTARHGYHTVLQAAPPAEVQEQCDRYRETWAQHKDDPGRHNGHVIEPRIGIRPHVVVAERDGEAMDLCRAAHKVWEGHIA